tara:strand:+ start:200 stop:343 length:144 start_codon:yes stop_codon:yes gene_type:complete
MTIFPLLIVGSVRAADIVGPPKVFDGETLEVNGKRLGLWGIDAPDPR